MTAKEKSDVEMQDGGNDQKQKVDSTPSLRLVADLKGHSETAWDVAWNPSLPILASCSSDKEVRLFSYTLPNKKENDDEMTIEQNSVASTSSDQPKFALQEIIPTGHKRTVRSVAWSPSGRTLATASFDSTVGIWERVEDVLSSVKGSGMDSNDYAKASHQNGSDEPEWDCIGTLEGHDNECKAVAFSQNGGLLASCSRDKSVWVWEVQDQAEFDCLSVLMEHTQDVKCVAWHPKEEILASASYDDTIRLHIDDPSEDWFCYSTLTGHTSTVWSIAFSPCGTFLASGSEDQTVRIWRKLTPEQAEQRGLKVQGKIDGSRQGDRWICMRILKGWHSRSIYSVSWGHPSQSAMPGSFGRLATAGSDGSICVFEVSDNEDGSKPREAGVDFLAPYVELIARQWDAHGEADINCVNWAPASLKQSISRTIGEEVKIRELSKKDEANEEAIEASKGFPLRDLLASTADDGSVKVWSI
ncbi:hypothetical protein L7F22_044060 [Adiantum nelumboides]|nr:hypothetical protein [Adiantum nelumboides]